MTNTNVHKKNGSVSRKKDVFKAATVKSTADALQVTPRYVYMVINGDRNDEKVMDTYMRIWEGTNALLEAVKKLNLL